MLSLVPEVEKKKSQGVLLLKCIMKKKMCIINGVIIKFNYIIT